MKKFKQLNKEEMHTIKGGTQGTIMASGHDMGGDYVIIDDGSSCRKVYTKRHDGIFDD